jgi:hypothetical protein
MGPDQNAAAAPQWSEMILCYQLIRKPVRFQFSAGRYLFIYLII